MATPVRDLRRVPFSSAHGPALQKRQSHSVLPPSPYTPHARRASTTPSSAAAAAASVVDAPPNRQEAVTLGVTTTSFVPPESADAFARGGAEEALRNACLDVVATVSDDFRGMAHEIASALDVQLSFADDIQNDRGAHPYARREVAAIADALRLERDTWNLILTAWRSVDIRTNDLCSRRANLRFDDERGPSMPGTETCRRVLQWLEEVADVEHRASGGPQVKPLDDPAYRWQYTAARLGGLQPSVDMPVLATALGNTAPQANPLEEVEVKAEMRLAREIWRLVRAGRVEDAEELCRHVGQPWRAAVLGGGRNASDMSATGVKGDARRIWRTAARAIASSSASNIPPHERAVCGVLSGVLEPVLSVAESHEDRVWARLSALVDRAIERSLSGRAGVSALEEHVVDAVEDGLVDENNMEDVNMVAEEGLEGINAAASAVDVTYKQILEAFRESTGAREGVDSVPGEILACLRSVRGYISLGEKIPATFAAELLDELARMGRAALELRLEWACRFAAHVALFAKKAGLVHRAGSDGLSSFESVMVSYARLAINQELAEETADRNAHTCLPIRPIMYDLVARHLSELENVDHLVDVYTQVMASALRGDLRQEWVLIRKPGNFVRQIHERRTLCLQKAGKCFGKLGRGALNRIANASVEYVWERHLPGYVSSAELRSRESNPDSIGVEDLFGGNSNVRDQLLVVADTPTEYDEMSHDDQLVVRAIEFLIFPAFSNYEEALRKATTAARRFFLMGKRAAARHVVDWFPADALAEIGPGRCANELHELDCWRAYMAAVSRHNEWRTYYYSQRPAPFSDELRAAALADPGEVSYELQASANLKLEAYMKHMEDYTRVSGSTRGTAVEALRFALLFDGGWMRDAEDESPVDGGMTQDREIALQREREIRAVRKVGVPQLCALLHHVLHESGLYAEATDLATIIADEGLRLYEDFERTELGAFLRRIAHSAVLHADSTINANTSEKLEHPYDGELFEELPVYVNVQR